MKNFELRRHMEEDLRRAIAEEKRLGEFQLASVVQNSLLTSLSTLAGSPHMMKITHYATQIAVKSAVVHMNSSTFTVSEAVRGSMHATLNLSGHPMPTAIAVVTGGLSATHRLDLGRTEAYRKAVVSGIRAAVEDMGLDWEYLRSVIVHLAKYYPDLTPQPVTQIDGSEEEIVYA